MRMIVGIESWAKAMVAASMALAGCAGNPNVAPTSAPAESTPEPSALVTSPSSAASASSGAASSEPIRTATPAVSATPAASAAPPDRSLNDIRAVVAQNREAFRNCYDRAAQAHAGIKGTFTLKFVLAPDGSVKSAEADPIKSQIHAPELETCAVGVLRGLKFPSSRRGMESAVSYPFDFNPKGAPPKGAGAATP